MTDELYARQVCLPGVGSAGQAAIERSEALIPAGPSASAALAYLVRAGVGRAAICRAPTAVFPHRAAFRFSAPLALAEGAHLACAHLLSAVRNR